jgi:outer membrane protein OmpA-like peptidoglycan-associated protein
VLGLGKEHIVYESAIFPNKIIKVELTPGTINKWYTIFNNRPDIFPKIYKTIQLVDKEGIKLTGVVMEKLNTSKSEFSPVIWNDNFIFVAERENDLINFSHNDYNGEPFLDVYMAKYKGLDTGNPKEFSHKLNSIYHDGPVAFTKDNHTIFYTRTTSDFHKKKNEFVNKAKIYSASLKGNRLTKVEELKFDNDEYSVAHPGISDDGQSLFFSSDMPGGYGLMDLYVSKLNNGVWEQPVNLGPDINTSGSEEFPFFRSDGVLFFSSDGLPGFGGLDIFSSYKLHGKWILRRNEGLGINDITDDFGIFFQNAQEGYFSSDRPGGKGSDDIYKFNFKEKSIRLEGFVFNSLDSVDYAKNQKVILMDTLGNKIQDSRTDSIGYFKFDNLDTEKKYLVKLDDKDSIFSGHTRYYYADKDGNFVRVSKPDEKKGKFVFRGLSSKENIISDIVNADDFIVAGNVLIGDNNKQPLSNTTLFLRDEKGHIVDETTTNASGSFVFRNIPPGFNYVIEMKENDFDLPPDTRIAITNKDGNEIKVMRTDSKGNFKFTILAQETKFMTEMNAEDTDLIMDLNGTALNPDKKIIAGTKVILLDEKGNKIAETVTAADGTFTFKNLPVTVKYMLSMDIDDPSISSFDKVFIADKKGKIIKELNRKHNFLYSLLKSDENNLSEIYIDDPWLEVIALKEKNEKKYLPITIVELVYYAKGDWKFDDTAKNVLDKLIKIMIDNPKLIVELSSHTDSRGDDNFNLTLSKKRAKTAVDYCLSHGIESIRIFSNGFGETQLLNKCANGVNCSDEEHTENRRTEFNIHQK